MTSKLKYDVYCPFCGEGLLFWGATGSMRKCPKCDNNLLGNKELWQVLIQSQQQLKMLEPIVASLQGRADINAEVARDSNELVVQWYEKYEQSQKDLEIARKALKEMMESGGDGYHIARKALEQIEHKEE